MFRKVLVANRAAAASRVIRALRKLGIASVAVYSEADRDLAYVAEADEAYGIGPAPAQQSYLNMDRLLETAAQCGADAVHPGYGFLSENAAFAAKVAAAGMVFIGPAPAMIEAMGHKQRARMLMQDHGMPMPASSAILPEDAQAATDEARRLGFPVMIKPAAGGGGIGMTAIRRAEDFVAGFERARGLAQRSFGNAELYLERLVLNPRHVEFQILADNHGNVRHLFERDCSIQRRHQKVIEEASAPGLERAKLDAMAERAVTALRSIGYNNIGTVETLYDPDSGVFGFLEMNTRLQVEHAVTEEITGIDLVAAQIRLAAGEKLDAVLPADIRPQGHAIEARIYAEDPRRFLPSPGPLMQFRAPKGEGIRVETGYREGNAVTPFYDPMVAKLVAHGATRAAAVDRLRQALNGFEIAGIKTNIPFLLAMLDNAAFAAGAVHTGLAAEIQLPLAPAAA